jgi:hypothetical protein
MIPITMESVAIVCQARLFAVLGELLNKISGKKCKGVVTYLPCYQGGGRNTIVS